MNNTYKKTLALVLPFLVTLSSAHISTIFAFQKSQKYFDQLWLEAQGEHALGKAGYQKLKEKKFFNPLTFACKTSCCICHEPIPKNDVCKPCSCNAKMCSSCLDTVRFSIKFDSRRNKCVYCRKDGCYKPFNLKKMCHVQFASYSYRMAKYLVESRNGYRYIWTPFNQKNMLAFIAARHVSRGLQENEEYVDGHNVMWVPVEIEDFIWMPTKMNFIAVKNNCAHKMGYKLIWHPDRKKDTVALKRAIPQDKTLHGSEELVTTGRIWVPTYHNKAIKVSDVQKKGYKMIWSPLKSNPTQAMRIAVPNNASLFEREEVVGNSIMWKPISDEVCAFATKQNIARQQESPIENTKK